MSLFDIFNKKNIGETLGSLMDTAKEQASGLSKAAPGGVGGKPAAQFKEFCKSNHIKIMAAIQNASEKEYKKAIEAHPDLVNLDRPELFIKMLRQEIKK